MDDFQGNYGPWALVTGAAQGLGAAFAKASATKGLNLLLVDVLQEGLARTTQEIAHEHPRIEVRSLHADLGTEEGLRTVIEAAGGIEIGLLINNAAKGVLSPFLETPPEVLHESLLINCLAPARLTHALAPQMIRRGRGGIIFISSMTAFGGSPLFSHYGATKAYDLVLGESLWEELRHFGVDVLTVCPGATETPGMRSVKMDEQVLAKMPVMTAGAVVEEAFAAIGSEPTLIPGRMNRISSHVLRRMVSRKKAVELFADNMKKLYPGVSSTHRNRNQVG